MLQFFKDSIRELKHVVWPTRKETQKYFVLVLAILTIFGIYLFIFSTLFSEIIFTIKDATKTSISYDIPQEIPSDVTDLLISDEVPLEEAVTIDESVSEPEATQTEEVAQ